MKERTLTFKESNGGGWLINDEDERSNWFTYKDLAAFDDALQALEDFPNVSTKEIPRIPSSEERITGALRALNKG